MDEEENFNAEASGSDTSLKAAVSAENESAAEEKKGMSKNAMKKAAREARAAELRPLKRQAEKLRRQERARELAAGYANGTLSEADKEVFELRKAKEKERRSARKESKVLREDGVSGSEKGKGKEVWGGAVIMDLGFDELMTEQEIKSMASQLSFSYSTNRLASHPISALIHTSASSQLSPRLMDKLGKSAYDKWTRCHWYPDDLESLVTRLKAEDGDIPSGLKKSQEVVYLSADSEEELTELKQGEVYVIGGLVDRNRHKNICQNKAEKLGIRTARLPIGTYIDNLQTRKVLTVNQVFAILVEYIARKDWKEAFDTVIPPRKFVERKRKRGKAGGTGSGQAEEPGSAAIEEAEQDEADHAEGLLMQGNGQDEEIEEEQLDEALRPKAIGEAGEGSSSSIS